ncbi:BTB domain-containing protein [Mycena sanguinolenta]|uniref:BTB domain-containing protein n=1 Tax=Mycena sanguinolenta TaxID=230812 RepID=A0A8H7CHV4_9AGAR|nr:BTB domain-containing protein [Mycena sanguinolenta]
MAALQSTVHSNGPNRDKDHYHETGDSIIRVENVLFKIHKFPLTHNSSVFATMFNLPVGIGSVEGLSDDIPIVLEGEKAEDFRAVLKYIYAPPVQLQMERIPISALREIISLVKLSHKYEMDHWKEWGVEVLERMLDDLHSLPVEHLQPLYSLYSLVGDAPARTRVMKQWCEVIETNKLLIVPVLDAASAYDDRDAIAEAYCIQIRRWEKEDANVLNPNSYRADGLAQSHIQRIQAGYMSLSLSWGRFRSEELPYVPGVCTETLARHKEFCVRHSRPKWTQAIVDAEAQYPHVTQMVNRFFHVAQRILSALDAAIRENPFGLHHPQYCLHKVIKGFNSHLQTDTHLLANHFFPK